MNYFAIAKLINAELAREKYTDLGIALESEVFVLPSNLGIFDQLKIPAPSQAHFA